MGTLVRFRPLTERAVLRLERREQLHHARKLALVETCSRMAHVNQPPIIVVHAKQQRAEVCARLTRLGPAADDEFLLVDDFQLAPVGRALARLVERVGVLRDQPFPSALQRFLIERAAVAAHLLAQAEHRRSGFREEVFERGAPLVQRPPAVIDLPVAKKVERNERYRRAGGAGRAGSAGRVVEVNPALEILKAGRLAFRVERDDLAVEDERLLPVPRPLRERGGDFRKLVRLLVAEPRPQAHASLDSRTLPRFARDRSRWLDLDDRANAVVFRLVDEVRIGERRIGQRRQHRLQKIVHRRSYQLTAISSQLKRLSGSS